MLVDRYLPPDAGGERQRRHRTPAQLMGRLLRRLLIRVPGRRFVFAGDAGYGTHEVARFCRRHRARLTLVSKLHPEANLYDPPGPYKGIGRPPVKGTRRAKPSQAAGPDARREELMVDWYGGGKRRVAVVGDTPADIVGLYCGRWSIEKAQADCTSRRRWLGTGRTSYHRRDGVDRAGRVVPAAPGRPHRRKRMPDPIRRSVPPRA